MPYRPPVHRPPAAPGKRHEPWREQRERDHAAERARGLAAGWRMEHDPRRTARWQRVRLRMLREQPLCSDPWATHSAEGVVVAAQEVHHIEPVRDRPDLCFVRSNLMPLCAACHARFNAIERRKRANAASSDAH